MQRDMELIRKIMLAIESGNSNSSIEGYTDDQVKYHKALVIEKGLAEGIIQNDNTRPTEVPATVILRKLTWTGHDFIDAIADDSRWARVKAFLADSGKQLTIETVKLAIGKLFGPDSG